MASIGTLQYVTRTVDDSGTAVITSELIPAQAAVGDVFLCAADQRLYTVGVVAGETTNRTATVGGVDVIILTEGDFSASLGDPTWDQTVPATGDEATVNSFPDAAYFGVGPVSLSGVPSYVWVDGYGDVKVVSVADLVTQESYAAIANASKSITPVAAGAAPTAPYTVDALFAVQGERNVVTIDAYTSAQKEELLKFYNILDDAGNLTGLGAGIATRIVANETAEPAGNKFGFVDGEVVASLAWTQAPFSQVVEFEAGANWSVGFYPGRNPDDPNDEVAFADEFTEEYS